MVHLKENEKILKERLSNGLMALPFLRFAILSSLTSTSSSNGDLEKHRLFSAFSFLRYPRRLKLPNRKILIFSSTLFDIKNDKGLYFNQLHGFYSEALPEDSILIEDCDADGKWRTPNVINDISYFNMLIMAISKSYAMVMTKLFGTRNMKVDEIRNNYPLLDTFRIAYINYMCIAVYWLYKIVFKYRKKIRLIILNCASYGGVFASITKAARESGIIVAETQHGVINDIHIVYNVEDFVYNSNEYKEYLPDYLLTFGDFWNDHCRIAVNKITLGNPYIDYYKSNHNYVFEKNNNVHNILFISQPNIISELVNIITTLPNIYKYNITYRLHPADKLNDNQRKKFQDLNVIISDGKKSLYDEILRSDLVVGYTSTCLYEAMGLGRPVLVYNTEDTRVMYRDNPALLFKNSVEFDSKISNGLSSVDIDPEYYFKSNFNFNYNSFINSLWK